MEVNEKIKFTMELLGSTILIQFQPLVGNDDEAHEAALALYKSIENAAYQAKSDHIIQVSQKN